MCVYICIGNAELYVEGPGAQDVYVFDQCSKPLHVCLHGLPCPRCSSSQHYFKGIISGAELQQLYQQL